MGWCKYDIMALLCSVGGLDYGTVRAGAFMGLQLISNLEDSLSRQSSFREAARAGLGGAENGDSHQAVGAVSAVQLRCESLGCAADILMYSWHTDTSRAHMSHVRGKAVCNGPCGVQQSVSQIGKG